LLKLVFTFWLQNPPEGLKNRKTRHRNPLLSSAPLWPPRCILPDRSRNKIKIFGTERETKLKNFLNHLMTSAVLLVSLGVVAGTSLEAQTMNLHAVVPFAWQVNGRQLNAGDYRISKDGSTPVVTVRDTASGNATFLQILPASGHDTASRLVFHRYGDQYFLAAIVGTNGATSKMPVSKAERAVQSEQPREMAIVVVDIKPFFN
jgi:hypothetical protein